MNRNAYDADPAQQHGDDTQRQVNGSDQPKCEQVQRFVAVFTHRGVVVWLVNPIDEERADDEPSQHETVDQGLRWRLSYPLYLLFFPAAPNPRREVEQLFKHTKSSSH